MTRLIALLVTIAAVVGGVAGAYGSASIRPRRVARDTSAGLAPARLPGPGTSVQAVAVAYLDPEIVLSVDVVTGRLMWSGEELDFAPGVPWSQQRPDSPVESGVVGIYDPLDRRMYRYQGGIPGLVQGRTGDAAVALTKASALPVWSTPGALTRRGRLAGLLLADGRRIQVSDDAHGRLRSVIWPAPHGGSLVTRIAYRGNDTAITDPFGITRTYRHLGRSRAFELVPAAWKTGPGYRHWISPVLDGARETGWVQHRTFLGPPGYGSLIDGLPPFAGRGFAGVSYDAAANGGYVNLNLTSVAGARSLENEMRRRGLLDVSAIRPTYSTGTRLDAIDNGLTRTLLPIAKACHVSWGEGDGDIVITLATTLTPRERTALDAALHNVGAWVIIAVGGKSVCAIAT